MSDQVNWSPKTRDDLPEWAHAQNAEEERAWNRKLEMCDGDPTEPTPSTELYFWAEIRGIELPKAESHEERLQRISEWPELSRMSGPQDVYAHCIKCGASPVHHNVEGGVFGCTQCGTILGRAIICDSAECTPECDYRKQCFRN
jgi:hypothetical protein